MNRWSMAINICGASLSVVSRFSPTWRLVPHPRSFLNPTYRVSSVRALCLPGARNKPDFTDFGDGPDDWSCRGYGQKEVAQSPRDGKPCLSLSVPVSASTRGDEVSVLAHRSTTFAGAFLPRRAWIASLRTDQGGTCS